MTSPLVAGVDLGGTNISAVVLGPGDAILGADRRPTPRRAGPDEVPATIAASVHAAIATAGCDPRDVVAVGIGCPGQVDRAAGTIGNATILPDLPDAFPLAEVVSSHLSRPVLIDNDVRLAVAAELQAGAGSNFPSFLGVFLGTGVGAGLVLDGRLWHGRGNAGEFGYMVGEMDGRECVCGRRGCVEAYCGRAAMEREARARAADGRTTALFDMMVFSDRDRLTSSVWVQAVAADDSLAVSLVTEAQRALGAGLASVANLLDLDGFILGGGLATQLGEPFLAGVKEEMLARVLAGRPPEIRMTALADLSGSVGAAMLAREAV